MNNNEKLEHCDRALRYLSVRLYASDSHRQNQQLYALIDTWLDRRNESGGDND